MNHWFDRLAVRAAEEEEDQRLLTRRETVKAAAAGAVAVGALGSPLLSQALASPASCRCWKNAIDRLDRKADDLVDSLLKTPAAVLTPINAAVFVLAMDGLIVGTAARGIACGFCSDDDLTKLGKPPPPKFQPCTNRGGLALRDQCGGAPPPSGGGQQCPNGTHLCTDGLCCFGTDLCCANCGTGQCCVVEVGCACCG